MNSNNNQSGFTMIDTVIGIVILGFVLSVILFVLTDMNDKSIRNETVEKGTIYANSVMNYMRMHRYDENYNISGRPWTYPLGQDGGDFDDVDDFIGVDWSTRIPGYIGYQAISNVFYVDHIANDLLNEVGFWTDYKRITVSVTHAELPNPIILTSIMTPHGF